MEYTLVAGGAGFIGANLCRALMKRGENIICIDNLYTGSINNISDLLDQPQFHFIKHDIINPISLNNISKIYNLACPASPEKYQKDPIYTIKICTLGVINLLELAKNNESSILQASTSEIYGNPLVHPQNEVYWGNVNCNGIRACYDEGKRIAETLFCEYAKKFDLNVKILRIFNTYGPYMSYDDGRVISNFITQALDNENITIYGNGMQTRSFCYIDDMIEGIINIMDSKTEYQKPINIGNPKEISIRELAEIIINLTKSKSKLIYQSLPEDDPVQRKPDINKIRNLIGWTPKYDLATGINKTIQYFKLNKRLV